MTAVAATRPRFVNHRSEYLVGAARMKGCANPMMISPAMAWAMLPPLAFVAPAYRIQLPMRMRTAATMNESFTLR